MRFGVLGPLQVCDGNGLDHTPKGGRQRLLLVTLVAAAGAVVSVDRLVEALWGDDLPDDPPAALHNQISRLRRHLGADGGATLLTDGPGYRLLLGPDDVDAIHFERLLGTGEEAAVRDPSVALANIDEALALWRGRAYGELSDRPVLQAEATRLEELRARAGEAHGQALVDLGRAGEAIDALEAVACDHPLRERPQHLLMRALYAAGRQTEALAVYQRYRRRLDDDLGLEPSPELVDLEGRILRHELSSTAGPTGTLLDDARRPPRPPPNSFVGREGDVAAVLQRLAAGRMVTICGTGGVGKTRLALEVGVRAAERYPDGVHLVELAGIVVGAEVATTVATALRVPQRSDTSTVDRLVEGLSGRRLLVVLDNCEHVLDGVGATVDPILRGTDEVDVLATSRAALAVNGEHVWPLPPLGTDGPASAAIRLFTDRALAADPGVSIHDGEPQLVEDLCRRLDGIPLALELAAARLRVASLAEVAAAAGDRSDLLGGDRRHSEARHRSLEALVEWSYQLLDADERQLFARLSVFQGSFDLDDATVVAAGDGLDPKRLPALVWALADQSLVSPVRAAPGRYAMLETLRSTAREKLVLAGEERALQRRHARFAQRRATEAATALEGPGAAAAMASLDQLLPELRANWRHLEEVGDLDAQLRLCDSLFWYSYSGIHSEVLGWAKATAQRVIDDDHPLVPSVLGAAAAASWQHGDLAGARSLGEAAVAAAVRLGDPLGSDRAYNALSEAVSFEGDVPRFRQLALEAHTRAERAGRPLDIVYALTGVVLAWAYSDQPTRGLPAAEQAIAVATGCGSPLALAWAAYVGGEVRLETEPERALELLDDAVTAAHHVGDRMVAGVAALSALTLRSRLGRLGSDLSGYRDLIEHWRQVGAWTLQWTTLRNLIDELARQGEEMAATRLLGASQASPRASASFGAEAARLKQAAEGLRRRLGERFEAELTAGRHLGDEAALALALEVLDRRR